MGAPASPDVRPVLEGPVRQIGIVVPDLDQALQSWLTLGVGPWFTLRDLEQRNCRYRGARCDPTISIALANTGPLQVELIQPIDQGPSIFREFLDAGRDGFHQLAWWVTDFDATVRRAGVAGWPVVFAGGDDVRFAYFELDPRISTIVEVTEVDDATRGLADLVRGAAAGWDGVTDPVRPLVPAR